MSGPPHQPEPSLSSQDEATVYAIRLRKDGLASQGLAQHTRRFHSRYEAGWLATLVEEFYVLLDGPDPRASLLYPLLYHRFEQFRSTPERAPHLQEPAQAHAQEGTGEIDLADVQAMATNLENYFDEEE